MSTPPLTQQIEELFRDKYTPMSAKEISEHFGVTLEAVRWVLFVRPQFRKTRQGLWFIDKKAAGSKKSKNTGRRQKR